MVVKSATKKKLMDLGIAEEYAHRLADDRKWDDVKVLAAGEIAQICATDSGMAQKISEVIQGSTKASQKVQAEDIDPTSCCYATQKEECSSIARIRLGR